MVPFMFPVRSPQKLAKSGDIKAETGLVMQNIGHILGAAGLGFPNVVKASIFLP
jgi:2-iminobutanoate/2-iminopropanoate deaminase